MYEPRRSTLQLCSDDTAILGAPNATTNVNQGTGTQQNSSQNGGYGNSQYNAGKQNFHYHGGPPSQGKPQMRNA
jgi:hypothetical protein